VIYQQCEFNTKQHHTVKVRVCPVLYKLCMLFFVSTENVLNVRTCVTLFGLLG